jgi:Dynein heavy chain C-terminal domain
VSDTDFDWDKIIGVNLSSLRTSHKLKANALMKNIIKMRDRDFTLENSSSFTSLSNAQLISNYELNSVETKMPDLIEFPEGIDLERICKYSYMKRFFVKEIREFNYMIAILTKEFNVVKGIVEKKFYSEPYYKTMIDCIMRNIVPDKWKSISRLRNMTFNIWLKHLQERQWYWMEIASKIATSILSFELNMIGNPKDLFDAYFLDHTYRRAPTMGFHEIILTFRIMNPHEKMKSTSGVDIW